jgi:hypothetical protein
MSKNTSIKIRFGILCMLILPVFLLSVRPPKASKTRSLLSTNDKVIVGDNQYYLRAVLEYYLAKALIAKFGIIYPSQDPNYPMEGFDTKKKTSLPATVHHSDTTHNIMAISFDPRDHTGTIEQNNESLKIPYRTCRYKIPKTLADLTSGLTFRYYRFNGSMKASMQAFGIASSGVDTDTDFIVIDYLQYKDCVCDGLPPIRYAAGLRTELKFVKLSSRTEFNSIGSMPQIAAQVQLGQTKVTFSMKSIGLTGPAVRFNIPSEMDFNVVSYREFQNAIEFLRGLEIEEKVPENKLKVDPVMIPVLDDFRTDFESSLYDMVREIRKLIKLRKIVGKKIGFNKKKNYCDSATYDPVKCNYQREIHLIDKQINTYVLQREYCQQVDSTIGTMSRYDPLIKLLQKTDSTASEGFKGFYDTIQDIRRKKGLD